MADKFILVGLTGSMGSGKSEVAAVFAAHGARIIDSDQLSRDLVRPGCPGWLALKREFGEQYFTEDGDLDRERLRRAIFSDPAVRRRVNEILHPLILAALKRRLAQVAATAEDGCPSLVVVEVPLLYEAGWQGLFDLVVAVRVGREELLGRLMRRDRLSRKDAEASLAAQMPSEDKVSLADHVIDNNGSLAATRGEVEKLITSLRLGTLSPAGR